MGASGHAKVIADIVRLRREYTIVGYLDGVDPSRRGEVFLGKAVLGGEEQRDHLLEQGIEYLMVGFGDCHARIQAADKALHKGYKLATALHPSVVMADDVKIGVGTVIAAGVVINPAVSIGENVIVCLSSNISHDCQIEDGALICPGVHLAGGVRVGRAAFIGTGASVINQVQIGAGSIVGAGAVVLDDIPPGVLAHGNPARGRRLAPAGFLRDVLAWRKKKYPTSENQQDGVTKEGSAKSRRAPESEGA
jgi:sugar O-acyltransferase (sialic acid O-acetyltransferase NeuD family)